MPRLKRRETNRRENTLQIGNLSIHDYLNLKCGHTSDDSSSVLTTEEALQIAWETNRETMLTLYEDKLRALDNDGREPGEMPACWWRFEAPGERLICGYDPYHAPAWEVWHTVDGVSRKFSGGEFIENMEHEESEACFLIRHGILEEDERRMLARRHAAIREHVVNLGGAGRCNCRMCATADVARRFRPLERPSREQRQAFEIEQELLNEITG